MQKDALDRLDLKQMLFEPELPDVHLVSELLSLKNILPNKTKDTGRIVVQEVVDELKRKLDQPTRQAVLGSLNRAARNRRPRRSEIDWIAPSEPISSINSPSIARSSPRRVSALAESALPSATSFSAISTKWLSLTLRLSTSPKTRRSRRRPFRNPTRWRDGHQSGPLLLSKPDPPATGDDSRSHQRSFRRRRRQ
jgi:hypothetical protein